MCLFWLLNPKQHHRRKHISTQHIVQVPWHSRIHLRRYLLRLTYHLYGQLVFSAFLIDKAQQRKKQHMLGTTGVIPGLLVIHQSGDRSQTERQVVLIEVCVLVQQHYYCEA
jgi:hypothetical protein